MDRQKLIATLVERHGLKLDPNDPAFLIVDLNLLMLGEHTKALAAVTAKIENLPATAEQKLKEQTTMLLKASHGVQQDLLRLAKAVDQHTNKTVGNALKSAQGEVQAAAAAAVSNALENSNVSEKVGVAVNDINSAAKALKAHTELSLENIKEASVFSAKSPWSFVAIVAVTSLLAAIVGGVLTRYVPTGQSHSVSVSEEDTRRLEYGRMLEKIWPVLTEKERQRITDLSNQTQ